MGDEGWRRLRIMMVGDDLGAVDIPAVEGMAKLVEQLDALARRRPRDNRRVPLILLRGPKADDVVRGYRHRLIVDGGPSVPHALHDLTRAAEPTDLALCDDLAVNGLSENMPRGVRGMRGPWGLRLPRYRTISHVLSAVIAGPTAAGQRRQLRDALYRRRGELGAPHGGLVALARSLADGPVGPLHLDWAVERAMDLSRWVFGVRLRLGRQFRWVGRALVPSIGTTENFLEAGRRLLRDPQLGGPDGGLAREVLTSALVRDLQRAVRPSLLSPFRRRRVTPFVVHLVGVAGGSSAERWCQSLKAVHSGRFKRYTLMVVASVAPGDGDDAALVPADAKSYSPAKAAEQLQPLAKEGAELALDSLVVDTSGSESTADRKWLDDHRKVQPMPVPGAVLVPALAWATVAAVVVYVAWSWIIRPDGSCDVDERVAHEVVGVGDGTTGCSFFEDALSDRNHPQHEVAEEMDAAADQIAGQNEDATERGHRYVSVVFFAPLTTPAEGSGRLDENALNQLRGIAMVQAQANEDARNDPNKVFTQVLLANPGDRFAYGEDVAEQIVERVDDDESVVGVVGIAQSRGESRDAIDVLEEADVPVVAGPVTGDEMVRASSHYFQVSPRNERIARMLVALATQEGLRPEDDGARVVPDNAVLVGDWYDEYSWNLASDIHQALGQQAGWVPERIQSFSHTPATSGAPDDVGSAEPEQEPEPVDGIEPNGEAHSPDQLAEYVCGYLDERTVVFYTGRSQQLGALLRALDADSDCPDRYTMVGGSALTKIVEDRSGPVDDHPVSLYYPAFASRFFEYPADSDAGAFVDDYEAAYVGRDGGTDLSDAAAAYDAFDAARRAANNVYGSGLTPTASAVAQELANGEIAFNGATGYVEVGSGPLNDSGPGEQPQVPRQKLVLVLRVRELGGPEVVSEVVLACGRVTDDLAVTTWGAAGRPCPDVD
jgi:hypothetical protein